MSSFAPTAIKLAAAAGTLLLMAQLVFTVLWFGPAAPVFDFDSGKSDSLSDDTIGPSPVEDICGIMSVDISWYAPAQTVVNNLTAVLAGTDVYGFIYDTSNPPDELYGTYNWCNMPHVRKREYAVPSEEYELQYVEIVCTYPISPYVWLLFFFFLARSGMELGYR
jgi:hypothetical protein